jgi:thiosulfate dehydrogenase
MKRFRFLLSIFVVVTITSMVLLTIVSNAIAQKGFPDTEEIIAGAQLYDDWTVVSAGGEIPTGNHPIWSRQSQNTQSGLDTWRCITCHGWDYQGNEGAFRSGAYATGFPGVLSASTMDNETLVNTLNGTKDPQHDFSTFLTDEELNQLADFLQYGLIDDNLYIDPVSRKVTVGDITNGQTKYEESCLSCHGEDGTQLPFRYEGKQITLGTLAVQDPWRFLHRTRFGTARAPEMPVGANLGWSELDGRDVLMYVQTNFPTGFENSEQPPAQIEEVENQGGPAQNWITGILTAFSAMTVGLGFALLLGAALIGIILLLVWFLRNQKS